MKRFLIVDSQLDFISEWGCQVYWTSFYHNKELFEKDSLSISRDFYIAISLDCDRCACVYEWHKVVLEDLRYELARWIRNKS